MKHSMLLKFFIVIATSTFTGPAAAEEADATEFDYAPKYINQYEAIRSPYYEAADSDGLLPSLDEPAPAVPKYPNRSIASVKAPKAPKKASKLASKATSKAKAKVARVAKAKSHPKRKIAARLQRKPFKVEALASSRVARPDFLYRTSPEQAPELQYH
jgi:hypothetical protein